MAFKPKAGKKRPPRAKGEGGIFQRKDGMWVGSIELGYDENGKRKQKRVYSSDYRTLVAKLEEIKLELTDGLSLDRTVTVEKWLGYWLPHVHKERIRPTTYRDYECTVNNIVRVIGRKKLVDLQPSDVRRMHAAIGRGERRAEKAHVLLHRALKDAVAEGLLRRNVVDAVDAPEVYKGERKPFTVEQAHQILGYASERCNKMEYTRWLLAFLTGARQSECLGLTWDRVDLDAGAIDISWQLQQLKRAHGCGTKINDAWPCGRKHGSRCTNPVWDVPVKFEYRPVVDSLAFTRPKSAAGKRWVPIIEPLRLALETLRDIDQGPNPYGLVFHRGDGYPVTPTEDNRAWNDLLGAVGISSQGKALTLHSARRTAATVLRAAGADEQTRMEILGHNSPEVTRIYAHADQARNSTAMNALAVLLPERKELP
ncbi:endonuclease [Mycobacterium phage ThetaBob]|uniref:Integrase n=1 Tax=Mycobacterium phage ThetaBob TaxID=2588513 RepID=A0A4Y6EN82_9CAUD|nr:endonuclease [Mycobacterium phage ThetaBob]QDF19932.1 tyrosine integrase [Mycobacterium phage ThetaBob]